jgi:phospholipid-binding lipoprotein MlaA
MSVPVIGAILLFAGAPPGADVAAIAPPVLTAPNLPTTIPNDRPASVSSTASDSAPALQPVVDIAASGSLAPGTGNSAESQAETHVQDHGEIVVMSRARNVPGDPLQELNLASFRITQAVDETVVRPAAIAYSRIVPEPVRLGIRNFLDNLQQPVVFANFLAQHKIGKAAETFVRFGINSTIGVLGLFDFAKRKPFKLPNRKNGFGSTLGFYGVKPGPFLYLPIVGPTTARDLVGLVLDRLLLPIAIGKTFRKPVVAIPLAVLGELDQRDQFDEKMEALKGDASGYYTATREEYLRERQIYIDELRGKRQALPALPLPSAPPAVR